MLKWVTSFTQKFEDRALGSPVVYNLLEKYYKSTVENEQILGSITQADHMLCIGGGICPLSAILFSQNTGAKVTVIDNNLDCVTKAKQAVAHLGLSDQIRVLHQDGAESHMDFAQFSVVHLALQVSPLDKVFTFIDSKIAPGTRVLVRRPKQRLKGLYCQLSQGLLACCPYTTHSLCNTGTTLLYVKDGKDIAPAA